MSTGSMRKHKRNSLPRRISIRLVMSLFVYWLFFPIAQGNEIKVDQAFIEQHLKAVALLESGRYSSALILVDDYKGTPLWHIINAFTLSDAKQYDAALQELEKAREWLDENIVEIKQENESSIYSAYTKIAYLHYNALIADISFRGKEWKKCVVHAKNTLRIGLVPGNIYRLSGCYDYLGETDNALKYMTQAYKLTKETSPLDQNNYANHINIAYNVSALHGRKGSLLKSLEYLKIVLENDGERYLPKIEKDKDFDKIRKAPAFVALIKKFKK